VFAPGVIDAERHHDTVLADVNPVDQQRHEIERVEGRRPPGGELRRGLRDEPTAHGTLARPARGHGRRQRLETASILTGRHTNEHLFDDPTIQGILARHQLKRRQRHFRALRADPRTADGDLPTPEDDLARHRAGPRRLAFSLMLIAGPADRRPIFFEHRGEDLQARGHRELHQLRPRIHEQIHEREVALGWRIDLVRPIDCVRLSLHGGSLLAGFRPGLVTTRLPRAVRSRRSQISTATGKSPSQTRLFLASLWAAIPQHCHGRQMWSLQLLQPFLPRL
jgi:hypothetical protein